MPKAYIMVGLPGVGKSTWYNNQKSLESYSCISTDIFIENFAKDVGKTYSEVFDSFIKDATNLMMVKLTLAKKHSQGIIWDQTNLTVKSRANKIRLLDGYECIAVVVGENLSCEEHDRRLDSRPDKHIPHNVLSNMIRQYQSPKIEEGFSEIIYVS